MLEPLADLSPELIVAELRRSYGITGVTADAVVFTPVGEDSWCYRVAEWWVSVRRDLRGHVPGAYALARKLYDQGLRFVLAPAAATDGRTVTSVSGRPLVVFPYREAVPLSRTRPSPAQLAEAEAMIERVHASTTDIDLPRETYALPFDGDLDAALALAEAPLVPRGPFSAKLHALLASQRHTLAGLRAEAERAAKACLRDRAPYVVTHGEPSAPNILSEGGRLLLADWGGAMWAPPERDWFSTGRTLGLTRGRPELLRFYVIRWRLSEIAEYTAHFRGEHRDGADDRAMWQRLSWYLGN